MRGKKGLTGGKRIEREVEKKKKRNPGKVNTYVEQRVLLEVRAAQTVHFWENFKKQKLKYTPIWRGRVRSNRSKTSLRCPARGPSARGAFAGMVSIVLN